MQKLDKHTHKHDLMKTQDIIVHPKTLKQFNALKEFMSAFKIDFELTSRSKTDSKTQILSNLEEAVQEMKMVNEGKLEARNIEDLLNEL